MLLALLRMAGTDELAESGATTPTMLDYLASYRDGIDVLEYQIIGGTNAGVTRPVILNVGQNDPPPNSGVNLGTATKKIISYASNVLAYDKWRGASSGSNRKPRGTFIIKRISNTQASTDVATVANNTIPKVGDTAVYIDVKVTEPLLMSPFIFGSPENKQGFYGVSNMNFQMNLTNANRAWRSVKFREVPPLRPSNVYKKMLQLLILKVHN